MDKDYDELIEFIKDIYAKNNMSNYFNIDMMGVFSHNLTILTKGWVAVNATIWFLYGPQGSGKSSISKRLLKNLEIELDHCMLTGIDDYVYNSKWYKDEFAKLEITDEYKDYAKQVLDYAKCVEENKKIDKNIENNLMSHPMRIKITNLYMHMRKIMGQINDKFIHLAIKHKIHLIFELVGNNFSANGWYSTIIQDAADNDMDLCVLYPYVSPINSKIRYLRRAIYEHYSLNIYDESLIPTIINEFKTFSDTAIHLYIIDNNKSLPNDNKSVYTILEVNQIKSDTCAPKYAYLVNADINICKDMRDTITYIVTHINNYMNNIM